MTTRMLTNNRPEYYHRRRVSRGTCTAGTGAHLLRESYTPGTPGGLRHIYPTRMVRMARSPQKVNKVIKREGGCNTARYSCPPKTRPGHAGGHRLATRGHTDPLPAGTDMLRRAQPATTDGTSRHHSTSRTALTILTTKLSTATQARHPHDPQDTARYSARQAGRHEHEHRTTELGRHPGAPMGSTGARQGGPTGPYHRRGVYI